MCGLGESAELISTAAGISRILPVREVDLQELNEISFGRTISASVSQGPVAALSSDGSFVALLENSTLGDHTLARPTLVSMKE